MKKAIEFSEYIPKIFPKFEGKIDNRGYDIYEPCDMKTYGGYILLNNIRTDRNEFYDSRPYIHIIFDVVEDNDFDKSKYCFVISEELMNKMVDKNIPYIMFLDFRYNIYFWCSLQDFMMNGIEAERMEIPYILLPIEYADIVYKKSESRYPIYLKNAKEIDISMIGDGHD
jgi:hypothetical protein